MSLNIGSPPPHDNRDPLLGWIVRSLKMIELHIRTMDVSNTTDAFQLTDRDALTPLRELDETAATTSQVRQVLATLIDDLNARGSKAR